MKTAIEPLLAPEIYRTVLDAMTDQIKAIKMVAKHPKSTKINFFKKLVGQAPRMI